MAKSASILQLPNEILLDIFQYVVDHDIEVADQQPTDDRRTKPSKRHRSAWALCLSCKQFDVLVRPLMYADVEIRGYSIPPYFAGKKIRNLQHDIEVQCSERFCWTMETSPALQSACKILTFHAEGFERLACLHTSSNGYFTNLRTFSLSVRAPFTEDPDRPPIKRDCSPIEKFQDGLAGMTGLHELELTSEDVELRFDDLQNIVGCLQQLRRLKLTHIGCPDAGYEEDFDVGIGPRRAASDAAAAPPPGMEGTAAFTDLRITWSNHMSPFALRNFLHWPARLEVFHLDNMAYGDYDLPGLVPMAMSYPWTFLVLARALEDHSSMLRELRVGQMGPQVGIGSFDLRPFHTLETFQVCMSGLTSVPPSDLCELWLTPSLERLVLQCSHDDSQHGIHYYITDEQVDWFAQLANVYGRLSLERKVALKTIELIYDLHGTDVSRWDASFAFRIHKVDEILAAEGIELIWPADLPGMVSTWHYVYFDEEWEQDPTGATTS